MGWINIIGYHMRRINRLMKLYLKHETFSFMMLAQCWLYLPLCVWWYGADTNTVLPLSFYIRFKIKLIILIQVLIYKKWIIIIIIIIIIITEGNNLLYNWLSLLEIAIFISRLLSPRTLNYFDNILQESHSQGGSRCV